MTEPPIWTAAELAADAERAKAAFRTHRLREPLALYSRFFKAFAPIVAGMVDRLPSLTSAGQHQAETVADIIADDELRTAFRYLAAPPISEDNLKTLAETTLSATALRSDEAQARRVRETVLQVLDPHRFPWLADERSPTESERLQAIVSSAALIATRKVETARRSAAKNEQELAVKAMLLRAGLVEVPAREISDARRCAGLGRVLRRVQLRRHARRFGGSTPRRARRSHRMQGVQQRRQLLQAHQPRGPEQGAHMAGGFRQPTGGTHRRDRRRVQPGQSRDGTECWIDDHLAPPA